MCRPLPPHTVIGTQAQCYYHLYFPHRVVAVFSASVTVFNQSTAFVTAYDTRSIKVGRYYRPTKIGRRKSADFSCHTIDTCTAIASTKWLIRLKMKHWQHFIAVVVANEKKENTIGATMDITHVVETLRR